jgi:hypothetical protein
MSCFPASKYVRYKRATAFFLDWLLRAHGHRRQGGERVQLQALNTVVMEIAAQPSSITAKIRKDLPKALAACQCAITLRECVADFFADGEHAHQHFLGRLRAWIETLKGIKVDEEAEDGKKNVHVESSKFKNYYDILEVDEDYCPDEATYVAERSASNALTGDRQRLLEEVFAEDIRLEVVYFFAELEELAQEVFEIYEKVKKRERTVVEAAVVVKLALDTANGLTVTLQLRYPSLNKGLDFLGVVMDSEPEKVASRMHEGYNETCRGLKDDGVYRFFPGMFLMDFLSAGITLEYFIPMIPPSLNYGVTLPPRFYGEAYNEEKTHHFVIPDNSNMVTFPVQHLSVLYDTLTYTKVTTFRTYDPREDPDWRLSGCFMAPMNEYFTRREINI